jgi:hypothetical protein
VRFELVMAVVVGVFDRGVLDRAVCWLEPEVIQQVKKAGRSKVNNGTAPPEPPLSEAERADNCAFLREILQVLPVMGLHAFEEPKLVATPQVPTIVQPVAGSTTATPVARSPDEVVVVVPAQKEGFKEEFLGKHQWYAIRLAGGKLQQIRYIATYQTKPISAVTHYAPVAKIEPSGGKAASTN